MLTYAEGDLKPDNILLDMDLHPRISDCGLARTLRPNASHATSVVSIAGTDGFMDEYYRQTGRYDAKSDAYSMGVTLLIILTGWPVFDPALGDITGRCEVEGDQVIGIADQRAEWPLEVAREMHKVAMALLKRNRNSRMSVSDARDEIRKLADGHLFTAPAYGGRGMEVERDCVVCMSEPRYFRFGECGHSALCRGCMDTFMLRERPQCPNCRAPVSRQHLIQGADVAREHTFVRPLRALGMVYPEPPPQREVGATAVVDESTDNVGSGLMAPVGVRQYLGRDRLVSFLHQMVLFYGRFVAVSVAGFGYVRAHIRVIICAWIVLAVFLNNWILMFRNWIFLSIGNFVLLMVFLIIMESAPMGVGARFATLLKWSFSGFVYWAVEFFWLCFLGLVFCGCCGVVVEILRSICGVTYITGTLGASGCFLVGEVLAVGV